MARTRKVKPGPQGGRPKIEIDLELVRELCTIQCTAEEIASVLGVSADTLDRRLREHEGCSFAEYRKRHAAQGAASLRRQQWHAAHKGNVTMMIWLGKQVLGQRDQASIDHSGLNVSWKFGDDEIKVEAGSE